MKRKIIFLCMLMSLGTVSNSIGKIDEPFKTYSASNVQDNGISYDKEDVIGLVKPGKYDLAIANPNTLTDKIKCANCNKLNFVDVFAPYDVDCIFCGLPVRYKVSLTRECINCKNINNISLDSTDQTVCYFCDNPIGIFKCINCNETTNPDKNVCEKCNCWTRTKVYRCYQNGCKKGNVIDNYSKYGDCPCGNHKIYKMKKCINCNSDIKVFLDYQDKEEIFYEDWKYPIPNSRKCPNCSQSFNHSDKFTAIQGTFTYYLNEGSGSDRYPLFGCRMILKDDGDFSCSTLTDKNGFFKFKISNSDLDSLNGHLHITARPVDYDSSIRIVNYKGNHHTKAVCNLSSRSLVRGGIYETYEHSICINTNIITKAFLIGQAAMCARNYARDMMSRRAQPITPEPVTILYPSSDSNFNDFGGDAFYRSNEKTIHIAKNYDLDTETVMHEYGHHISYQVGNISHVDYSGGHFSDENHINRRYSFVLCWQELNYEEGTKIAWYEAWPYVFAQISREYAEYNGYDVDGFDNYWLYYEKNNSTHGYNYDHDTNTRGDLSNESGEGCEHTVEQILWDVFDNEDDEYHGASFINTPSDVDFMSLGYQAWFDISTLSGTYTLKDFCDTLCGEYDYLKPRLIALLEQHEIYFY